MRCKGKSINCQVTPVRQYLLKCGVRQSNFLHKNSCCGPEVTGAGGISVTIIGNGCHAMLFWCQDISRNGGEAWRDFLRGFLVRDLAVHKQISKNKCLRPTEHIKIKDFKS